MASTPVHFQAPSGLTLTMHIFALSPDAVIVNTTSTASTEQTNAKGHYVCVVTEALAGNYRYHIKSGTAVVGSGFVKLADDTTIYYAVDHFWQLEDVSTIGTNVAAILVDTGTTLDSKIDIIDGIVDSIVADTNELQTDWANGGRLDVIVDAILDDTDLIDDGTSGLAKIATDVAAILVDTGTTLQAELDGIQADTEDIQSRLPAALVDGRIDATIDATGLEAGALALINAEVLDVIGTDTIVAGVTIKEAIRRIGAITSGKVTNAGTGTETFKDFAESANTIVITVDSSGNRSAITYN